MSADVVTNLIVTVFALIGGFAAMIFAVRKQPRMRYLDTLDRDALLKRVADLEDKTKRQDATIATLQDLLYQKQGEIDQLKDRIRQLEATEQRQPKPEASRSMLLACIGDDPMLRSDLAYLRRVQAQRKVRLITLDPVTLVDLENALDRQRLNRTPVRYVHFGVHSDQTGLVFADGVATWEWLSQRLDGVDVVVLAGCSNDRVADKLRVVDAVVSIRARELPNKDAGPFAEAFWMAIGAGETPDVAFEMALEQAPARLGEYVELHL